MAIQAAHVNSPEPVPADAEAQVPASTSFHRDYREVLELWLKWNSMYEQCTAVAFQAGGTQERLEALMDEMDATRARAVQLSDQLLAETS